MGKTPKTSFVPLGQVKKKVDTALVRELEENWTLTVPSFEVWAAGTLYDDQYPDGGPKFQHLMHWALTRTDDQAAGIRKLGAVPHYDTEKQTPLGTHWKNSDDRYDGKYASLKKKKDDEEEVVIKLVYGPKSQSLSTVAGGNPGANTNESRGFATLSNKREQRTEDPIRKWLQGTSFRPQSQLQFLATMGFTMVTKMRESKMQCGFGNDVARQFASDDRGPKADHGVAEPRDGCVSLGVRMAAIYGLYYYPDCRNTDNNWVKQTTVFGKTFHIRMRAPNPVYKVERVSGKAKYLKVYEPVNPKYKTQHVGIDGFYVAQMYGTPLTCFDFLAALGKKEGDEKGAQLAQIEQGGTSSAEGQGNVVCRIAPWCGMASKTVLIDDEMGKPVLRWNQSDDYGKDLWSREMDGIYDMINPDENDLTERFYKRKDYDRAQTGGLAFGWTPPQALWLYPHGPGSAEDVEKADKALLPGYMQWPDFGPGGREASLKWKAGDRLPLVSFLERPVLRKYRQLYVVRPDLLKAEHRVRDMAHLKSELKGEEDADDEVRSEPAPLQNLTIEEGAPAEEEADDVNVGAAAEDNVEQTGQTSLFVNSDMDTNRETIAAYLDETAEVGDDAQLLEDRRIGKDADANIDKKLKKAAALEPGSKTREKEDGNGNHHFFSDRYAPWPWRDVYTEHKHRYDCEQVDKEEYKRKYGNTANLFLGGTEARKIKGVNNTLGTPRMIGTERVLDMPITAYKRLPPGPDRDMFERNMRAILRIYYDKSGNMGPFSANAKDRWSPEDKRKAMREGLSQGTGVDQCFVIIGKGDLLPPVFTEAPHWSQVRRFTTKEGHLARDDDSEPELPDVESDMTVLQWLQTPFHYEYLPYQPMQSVFREGESYCAGCTRCSRPFYEYKYLYATYFYKMGGSLNYTSHWPFMYWRPDKRGCQYAPLPFHHEEFWQLQRVNRVARDEDNVADEELDEARGYHNWPTALFLLGWKDTKTQVGRYRGTQWEAKGPKGILDAEWRKRAAASASPWVRDYHLKGTKWTFRRYLNHMHDEGVNVGLVQGKIASRGSKVAFGMRDYRLQRAVKYGNVCRDCAATLDLAPGLYNKPGASLSHVSAMRKVGGAMGEDTWWLALKNRKLNPDDPNSDVFDPWFLFIETGQDRRFRTGTQREVNPHTTDGPAPMGTSRTEALEKLQPSPERMSVQDASSRMTKSAKYKELWGDDWEDKYEQHMKAVEAYVRQQHKCAHMGSSSKVTLCEVNVQARAEIRPSVKQKDWDNMGMKDYSVAFKAMDELINWLDQAWRGGAAPMPRLLMDKEGNRAFRDMLHDTRFRLARKQEYTKDPDTDVKKFDPDMRRQEFRNLKLGSFKNCLRVVTYQGDKAPLRKDYKCTRKGPDGMHSDIEGEHEWRGDGFLLEKRGGDTLNQHPFMEVQTRRLTQTRVFITYSLHRRVRDEMEARYVMEKMADALRFLFNNDVYLCRMIRFGDKLVKHDVDSIARWTWEAIGQPNKEDKRGSFYGVTGANSYQYDTYRTHVEDITMDAGIEIGPNRHMPHFHALITINHWSYIHVDTRVMASILEQMFKGKGQFNGDGAFQLLDNNGLPFYTDNENPYIDIDLKPTDDWSNVIAAYVRKTTGPGVFGMLRSMTGDT